MVQLRPSANGMGSLHIREGTENAGLEQSRLQKMTMPISARPHQVPFSLYLINGYVLESVVAKLAFLQSQ